MNEESRTYKASRKGRFLKGIILPAIFFLVLFLPALWLQNRELNKVRQKPRLYRDSLYLPSGKSIKLVSLGYDRFMADFIWLRSIQAFGGHWETDRNYQPIFHLFDVITDLDPHFLDAYTFGNLVIGDEGGDQLLGLKLIDKGIVHNPRKYKLPYWAGYIAYWTLNDPQLAKYYYNRALKCHDVPGFVSRIVAYMELKSGRYRVAFEKYVRDVLEAVDQNDEVVENIALNRIPDIINEWQMFIIRNAAIKYFQKTGKDPENIHDLERKGVIDPYPLVVIPVLKKLIAHYKQQPGNATDHFSEIIDGCTRENTTFFPPHPSGYWYQFDTDFHPEEESFLIDGQVVFDNVKSYVNGIRRRLRLFYEEKGRLPFTKYEIYGEPLLTPEPLGGEWIYQPESGLFYSSTMPFL